MVYTMEMIPARYWSLLTGAGEMSVGLSFAGLAFAGGYIITVGGYGPLFLLGAALNGLGMGVFFFFMTLRRR